MRRIRTRMPVALMSERLPIARDIDSQFFGELEWRYGRCRELTDMAEVAARGERPSMHEVLDRLKGITGLPARDEWRELLSTKIEVLQSLVTERRALSNAIDETCRWLLQALAKPTPDAGEAYAADRFAHVVHCLDAGVIATISAVAGVERIGTATHCALVRAGLQGIEKTTSVGRWVLTTTAVTGVSVDIEVTTTDIFQTVEDPPEPDLTVALETLAVEITEAIAVGLASVGIETGEVEILEQPP